MKARNGFAHAIPHALLVKQAESIGIPLYPVFLPKDMEIYQQRMLEAANLLRRGQGILFLEISI